VLARLGDSAYLQSLADFTYRDLISNPALTYKALLAKVDAAILCAAKDKAPKRKAPYSNREFSNALALSPQYYLSRKAALMSQKLALGTTTGRRLLFGLWEILPFRVRDFVRPFVRLISR
jgi:hypothetical protein